MRIALLQQEIAWCDAAENRRRAERLMNQHPGADLYVLAEMFATGFCMRPQEMAEEADSGPTLQWMRRMATSGQCALAGSVAVHAAGRYWNRLYFVYPDGTYTWYDKHHLFTYGGEPGAYAPGDSRVVVSYQGFRILLQVCYDLRFPIWARNRGDYDMALYVANWPTSRIPVWDVLLRARALENQCYVVGVNRLGTDPLCAYCGHSVVVDAYGREALALGEEAGIASCSVELEPLRAFRAKFPVLADGDF